ncbi:hypothetical protein [Nocardiopsis sp. ATB16-24]|uniref:hypothetical protein n=1 Tax=Nocardiopsis sp. ATB16-24 TaxID=3019555 RepID=UPI002553AB49|nr:hypothetical protein [Nocardiopsis sp. ATB16-24]
MTSRIIVRPGLALDQVERSLGITGNPLDRAHADHDEHMATARGFAWASLIMSTVLVVSVVAGLVWLGMLSVLVLFVTAPTAFEHRRRGEALPGPLDHPERRFAYACPDDYICLDTLTPKEREVADRPATDVDTILDSRLPAPYSGLIDHAHNHAVLPTVQWQIANDLFKVGDGIRRLEDIDSSGKADPAARSRVQRALGSLRSRATRRVEVISSYAEAIRRARERVADADATRRMNELLAELEDLPSDSSQEQSLASLENLRASAEAVADLYEELS